MRTFFPTPSSHVTLGAEHMGPSAWGRAHGAECMELRPDSANALDQSTMPRWTVPSVSTRHAGLHAISQRNPSGAAT
jgi:hypothetical protein